MKKRILLTIPFILSSLLIGCGKPDKMIPLLPTLPIISLRIPQKGQTATVN